MRKDDSTGVSHARQRPEPSDHEPIRRWSHLPITEERARELVDEVTRCEADYVADALLELICGLMPSPSSNDPQDLNKRLVAGRSALLHAFTYTRRAANELGAYVVNLRCAEWE
jgi:hypothetical protein